MAARRGELLRIFAEALSVIQGNGVHVRRIHFEIVRALDAFFVFGTSNEVVI
jgi:hypothetical protein